jgi:hypothetical protein
MELLHQPKGFVKGPPFGLAHGFQFRDLKAGMSKQMVAEALEVVLNMRTGRLR